MILDPFFSFQHRLATDSMISSEKRREFVKIISPSDQSSSRISLALKARGEHLICFYSQCTSSFSLTQFAISTSPSRSSIPLHSARSGNYIAAINTGLPVPHPRSQNTSPAFGFTKSINGMKCKKVTSPYQNDISKWYFFLLHSLSLTSYGSAIPSNAFM